MTHKHKDKLIKDKMPMMISCDEATYYISKNQHEKLGLSKRLKLKFHLLMCIYCRRYDKQIRFITKIINRLKSNPDDKSSNYKLSDSKKEHLKKEIDQAS